ncbi:MAG TPA: nucleoside phosphorylase [Thermodesulfobacteriota bacterium]|nr:nucleoside phosphorylase [Thermodesulfobacteriota bacterium]
MDFFTHDPHSVVDPREMVMAFTRPQEDLERELSLENLALITFTLQDLHGIVQSRHQAKPIEAWKNRNSRIYRDEGWIVVQSPYGAPGTIMLLEELVAFGVRQAVFLGYCGTIRKGVGIGDIVLPTEAIREEGTSYHYLPNGEKSLPDPEVQRKLADCIGRTGLLFHQGTVWTTDAPYREAPEKIKRYSREGVLGVEMEMAAAFAFGKARGVSVGAALIVSDKVSEKEWQIGFFSPKVKSTRKQLIEVLTEHIAEIISQ